MSGKRRDYDGNFAVFDVNFILDDPRLDDLKATERWLYISLWCMAVRERRETLPARYGTKSIARRSRLDTRTTQKGVKSLQQVCLISINENNQITIEGVKDKHKNLKWKCGDINDDMQPHISPIKNKEKRIKNKEKRIKNKEVKNKEVNEKSLYTDSFETFWKLYPKRVGKGNASKAWKKAIKISSPEKIIESVEKQLAFQLTGEDEFLPYPATWLNQNRWGDDLVKKGANKNEFNDIGDKYDNI